MQKKVGMHPHGPRAEALRDVIEMLGNDLGEAKLQRLRSEGRAMSSPFVWSVLGAIAEATSRIRLLVRHPVPERETAPTEEREMLGASYPRLSLVRYRSGRGNRRRRRPCRKSR